MSDNYFDKHRQASRIVKLSSEEQIILHITRVVGETEQGLTDDYVAEVRKYTRKWQALSRLERAIRHLQENGCASPIDRELNAQDLPPHVIELALQDSSLRIIAFVTEAAPLERILGYLG